jgi:hypothetical protein
MPPNQQFPNQKVPEIVGPEAVGFKGFRIPGTPLTKGERFGVWIALALLFVVIIVFLAFFIKGLLLALPIYLLVIAIGVILFLALLFKKKFGLAIIVLIIFSGLGFGVWYMQYTPLGKQITAQVQVGGVGALESFRGLVGPLNVMKQIFQGTYNPEYLWRSDTVQSQYETVTDVGVSLTDVKPLRENFFVGQAPSIQGRIKAVAFPGQTTSVSLSATCGPAPGGKDCTSKKWSCNPESFPDIKVVKNRYFSCSSPEVENNIGVFAVDISAKVQDTQTIAGKQFVFANPNVSVTLEDPLKTWGISKESLKSWQKGDPYINLGLGAAGVDEYGYLEAGELEYYLGVSVENPASNKGPATLKEIHLFAPRTLFQNNCNINQLEFTCKNANTQELNNLGLKTTLDLCDCKASSQIQLNPGDPHINAFLKLVINDKLLGGADFGTFFVLATVKYDYEIHQLVPISVKGAVGG